MYKISIINTTYRQQLQNVITVLVKQQQKATKYKTKIN